MTVVADSLPLPIKDTPTEQILSVSDLNRSVRQHLEGHFSNIWVRGEISNISRPYSGHMYFTLKDDNAQVRCALFKHSQSAITAKLKDGDEITVFAKVSLYPQRGDYQLIVQTVQLSGEGLLQQKFEQLKKQLEKAGLFDPAHKKSIPQFPKTLGVITSATGAALQDMINVLSRRYPLVTVRVYPALVQGDDAPPQLISALERADQDQCDTLIIGRGGGSLEDLWAFNDEALAHAIFNANTPIISAVGHEVDFTIADFVADLRAPTPSAAAELATPSVDTLKADIKQRQGVLWRLMKRCLQLKQHRFEQYQKRLKEPKHYIQMRQQKVDILLLTLERQLSAVFEAKKQRLRRCHERLNTYHPSARLQKIKQQFDRVSHGLINEMQRQLHKKQLIFTPLVEKLNAYSPLNILARGYSIAHNQNGQVLRAADQTKVGETLTTRVSDGTITSQVIDIQNTPASHDEAS